MSLVSKLRKRVRPIKSVSLSDNELDDFALGATVFDNSMHREVVSLLG